MSGPAPKKERRRRNAPARGDWQAAPGVGWQHGEIPPPPTKIRKGAREAWATWFRAWYAAFWTPDMLPGLRIVARLYDAVDRGEYQRAGELRLQMDLYGMTAKGQADRRWQPPADAGAEASSGEADASPYRHLTLVGNG